MRKFRPGVDVSVIGLFIAACAYSFSGFGRVEARAAVQEAPSSPPAFVACDRLYSTGVDDKGKPLALGARDRHWSKVKYQKSRLGFAALSQAHDLGAPVFSVPGFLGNTAIGPEVSARTPSEDGCYAYQTIFKNKSASLAGKILIDDGVAEVFLNGERVPLEFERPDTAPSISGKEREICYDEGHFVISAGLQELNTLSVTGANAGAWHSVQVVLAGGPEGHISDRANRM